MQPGCGELVERGYCAAHDKRPEQRRRHDERRGGSTERGYDARWQRFRRWFLSLPENVICRRCGRRAATDVHHKQKLAEHPELKFDLKNLEPLCHECHALETAAGR